MKQKLNKIGLTGRLAHALPRTIAALTLFALSACATGTQTDPDTLRALRALSSAVSSAPAEREYVDTQRPLYTPISSGVTTCSTVWSGSAYVTKCSTY